MAITLVAAFNFWRSVLTKSPVLFFLTQANRIRAGKSSILIH
jgi:hypothetical protein